MTIEQLLCSEVFRTTFASHYHAAVDRGAGGHQDMELADLNFAASLRSPWGAKPYRYDGLFSGLLRVGDRAPAQTTGEYELILPRGLDSEDAIAVLGDDFELDVKIERGPL